MPPSIIRYARFYRVRRRTRSPYVNVTAPKRREACRRINQALIFFLAATPVEWEGSSLNTRRERNHEERHEGAGWSREAGEFRGGGRGERRGGEGRGNPSRLIPFSTVSSSSCAMPTQPGLLSRSVVPNTKSPALAETLRARRRGGGSEGGARSGHTKDSRGDAIGDSTQGRPGRGDTRSTARRPLRSSLPRGGSPVAPRKARGTWARATTRRQATAPA